MLAIKAGMFIIFLSLGISHNNYAKPYIETSDGTGESLGCVVFETITAYDNTFPEQILQTREKTPNELPVDVSSIIATLPEQEHTRQPLTLSPLPTSSFQALDDSLTNIPPDTMGTAGINHVMTTLNDRVRIQTKAGFTLSTARLATFFGASSSVFDPKIIYDSFNNRWVVTALTLPRSSSSAILIAVSQTSDPTAGWDRYTIKADSSGISWADYPSLGFNGKWIVIQTNMFSVATNSFVKSNIYVLNKANMYSGTLGTFKLFSLTGSGGTQTPATTYDNTHPSLYLLQNWNGNSGGAGYLRLYAINGPVGGETLSILGLIRLGATWASNVSNINGGFAPQFGTTRRIETGDARILSVVFQNGSLWASQTVFLPAFAPTHSAIQWIQIMPPNGVLQFGRIEDPTANLNSGTFYAYPSISVNMFNDVLIGYSFFNPLIYASSGYSFRLHTDPLNTLRSTATLRPGLDIYIKDFGAGRVKWGDYSNTVIDPNGIDFWTIQESADLRTLNGTSRWVTWWGLISPPLI